MASQSRLSFIYLSICLFVYILICLFVYLFRCLCVYLFIYVFIYSSDFFYYYLSLRIRRSGEGVYGSREGVWGGGGEGKRFTI